MYAWHIFFVFFLLKLLALSLYSILCISINISRMNKNETVLESSGHVEECSMIIVYIQHSLLRDRLRRAEFRDFSNFGGENQPDFTGMIDA